MRAKSQRRGGKSGVVNFPVKKTLRLCARLMADEFAFDLSSEMLILKERPHSSFSLANFIG